MKKVIAINFKFFIILSLLFLISSCTPDRALDSKNNVNKEKTKIITVDRSKWLSLDESSFAKFDIRKFSINLLGGSNNHNKNFIAFLGSSSEDIPYDRLYLIRLNDGKIVKVLDKPLNAEKHFNILNFQIGNRWAMWEEVNPGEVYWRIYAAPIDTTNVCLGKPFLVLSGNTDTDSRALFFPDKNDTFYLMLNHHSKNLDHFSAEIVAFEPESKKFTTIAATNTNYSALFAYGDWCIFTEFIKRKSNAEKIHVYSTAEKRLIMTVKPNNDFPLVHWPFFQSGYLTWSEFRSPSATFPFTYILNTKDSSLIQIPSSIDPVIIKERYAFIRSQGSKNSYGLLRNWEEIICADLVSHKKQTVLKTEGESGFLLVLKPNEEYDFVVTEHLYDNPQATLHSKSVVHDFYVIKMKTSD